MAPAPGGRRERVVDIGLEYRPGDRVLIRVIQREHRTLITDDGAALDRSGRPRLWPEVADRASRRLGVNISRHGAVSLPVVPVGPPEPTVVRRIAEASVRFYDELLELESGLG